MAPGADDDTLVSAAFTAESSAAVPALVAGRYQIVRWLGGGGMGRVYEVHDTELGERVALKMLRGELSEEALERFRREVRLTRRIQHPNVARMFDIGEIDGDRYLTMELIDGEPLTTAVGSTMPWSRLLPIAKQICAGLAAAHDKEVIHRDLKPDNVMVERATGRVVLTDFGIARSNDDANVTQTGMIIGTPRYMAPEQLAGSEIDLRADLFALGVMLYELTTGARPWQGDNAISIAVAQATQPMRPFGARAVPAELTQLVGSLLAIDPAHRPASAHAVAAQLDAIASQAPPPSVPEDKLAREPAHPPAAATESAIAVLPFAASGGDEDLAAGMREDLIDMLSTTPGLRVRPDGAKATADPRQRGRELEVDHVVTGSVRRIPSGLRVAARLIGVDDGFQIWAHRIDCAEVEVLAIGDDLGRAIARALSTHVEKRHALPTDPRAIELFVRARAELRRFWGQHALAATELLEQAIEIAPRSGPIAGLLACSSVMAWSKLNRPELEVRARQHIDRALALDHVEGYVAASQLHWNTGEIEQCARELRIALERAPMVAAVHETAGRFLLEIDPAGSARRHLETALELDPGRISIIRSELVRCEILDGNFERARHFLAPLLEDPDPAIRQFGKMLELRIVVWRHDIEGTIATLDQADTIIQNSGTVLVELVRRWHSGGGFDDARWQHMLELLGDNTARPRRMQLSMMQRACEVAMLLEQPARAVEVLRLANTYHLVDIAWVERCPLFAGFADPEWSTLRQDIARRAANALAILRSGRSSSPTIRGVSGGHVGRR